MRGVLFRVLGSQLLLMMWCTLRVRSSGSAFCNNPQSMFSIISTTLLSIREYASACVIGLTHFVKAYISAHISNSMAVLSANIISRKTPSMP